MRIGDESTKQFANWLAAPLLILGFVRLILPGIELLWAGLRTEADTGYASVPKSRTSPLSGTKNSFKNFDGKMKHAWIGYTTILLLPLSAGARDLRSKTASLYVTVEHEGRLVQGLTERNFRLYENGQERPFRLRKLEKPAAVAILIEHTRSSWTCLVEIESALKAFLAAAPKDRQYALATFANGIRMEVDFTKSREKILKGFSRLARPFWDAADSYDSVYQMLDRLARFSRRGVLIVLGSGFDSSSLHTIENVERRIESFNVVVYAIGVASEFRGAYELGPDPPGITNETFLRMLARKSGGETWFPQSENAFREVMEGISQTVEHQYRLVYKPQGHDDDRFDETTVVAFPSGKDDNRRFTVRVRDGWRW